MSDKRQKWSKNNPLAAQAYRRVHTAINQGLIAAPAMSAEEVREIAGRQRALDVQSVYNLADQAKSECARDAHEYAADLLSKNSLITAPTLSAEEVVNEMQDRMMGHWDGEPKQLRAFIELIIRRALDLSKKEQ